MAGRTIIFLDIDGVLQPHHQQDRFNHDMEKLREELAERFNNPDYLEMDRYDLAAVYYDWHKDAVERLRTLCIDYKAEIVISSAWRRSSPLYTLQCFFRIYDLHEYVVDVTVQDSQAPLFRAGEVKQYVDTHPEIERFVIFDDQESRQFNSVYPDNFVHTRSWIEEEHYERARQILDGNVPTLEAG